MTMALHTLLSRSHAADKQQQSQELAQRQASIDALTSQLQHARAEAARVLQHGEQARARAEAEAAEMKKMKAKEQACRRESEQKILALEAQVSTYAKAVAR